MGAGMDCSKCAHSLDLDGVASTLHWLFAQGSRIIALRFNAQERVKVAQRRGTLRRSLLIPRKSCCTTIMHDFLQCRT